MKTRLISTLIFFLLFISIVLGNCDCVYAGQPDVDALVASYYAQIMSGSRTEEQVANSIITVYKEGITNSGAAANILVKQYNVLGEYVDEFKAAGITIDGNSNSSSSASPSQQSQPKPKTEFTVEDVEPYTAWTTKNCNIRSGADTTHDKVGSLKKFEEVQVTGKASTGWYRIKTSSGVEAYISSSLLTTEDPKKVTVRTVEKNGEVITTTVKGENPLAVAEVVEEIQAEEAAEENSKEHEHSYTSEVTKEATCTEAGITTYTCECGDSYTEEIPKTEHVSGDWETSKKPTLIKDGEKVKKCTVCGEILETQKIPANTNVLIGTLVGCVLVLGGVIAGTIIYRKKH